MNSLRVGAADPKPRLLERGENRRFGFFVFARSELMELL
jgi:hypothetical protein